MLTIPIGDLPAGFWRALLVDPAASKIPFLLVLRLTLLVGLLLRLPFVARVKSLLLPSVPHGRFPRLVLGNAGT